MLYDSSNGKFKIRHIKVMVIEVRLMIPSRGLMTRRRPGRGVCHAGDILYLYLDEYYRSMFIL